MPILWLLCAFAGLLGACSSSMAESVDARSAELVVGLRDAPPFVFQREDGSWTGISVDLWEQIAKFNGFRYRYEPKSLTDLLAAVESGEVDVAVAALSINAEREELFDFTQPFMHSGIAIATKVEPAGIWYTLGQFVSLPFLSALGSLAGVVFVFGVLIWVFERKRNSDFGGTTLEGVGSGFWWSAVTMTTVGYGDKVPRTLGGRLVGLVWMYFAIIIISGFTAAIASALTVGSLRLGIESEEDLRKADVGVLEGSAGADFLSDNRIRYVAYPTLRELADALRDNEIKAVVHDAPLMKYEINRQGINKVHVIPHILEPQSYGFGLPEGSLLREPINQDLLRIVQTDLWEAILRDYLGESL